MKQGNQRIKGKVFEQKIARILKHIWPNARRGIQYRDGGKEAGDIEETPYHIECSKGGESIWAKWKQANQDSNICNPEKSVVVIKQRDREEPIVLMSLKEWLRAIQDSACEGVICSTLYSSILKQYKKEFGNL